MAEDFGDKTEAPTPRRRQEAREQGQVARSADLTAAVLLLGFLMLMQSFGSNLIKALRTIVAEFLGAASLADFSTDHVGPILVRAIALAAGALAPMLVGAMVLAVIANILQVGFHPSLKRLQPNFQALNPFGGFGRLFKARGGMQMVMNLLKLALVALVAWSAVRGRIAEIVTTQQLSFLQAFGIGCGIVYAIALRIGVVLLILAIIDYAWQRYHHEREMMMTKQEVKEEMRRMDGDPRIKARRRQLALQMMQQRLKHDVPTADVIVTNPTHIAIALKYDSGSMHAPRVVAKGRGVLARRIRELAVAAGIPIVERKPLARALYKLVNVGQEIPEQFYAAVAEILAYVYEITGKLKRAG